MNLQNVDQDHFSLASGWPQDRVTSWRVSVGVADTLIYGTARGRSTANAIAQDNIIISGYYLYYAVLNHIPQSGKSDGLYSVYCYYGEPIKEVLVISHSEV